MGAGPDPDQDRRTAKAGDLSPVMRGNAITIR